MNGITGKTSTGRASIVGDRGRVIDELLRRTLKIGDPRNPLEVANALRLRYGDQAAKLDQEGTGVPVTGQIDPTYLVAAAGGPEGGTGEREQRRVQENLAADLAALTDNPANRDFRPELMGWRAHLLREFAEGAAAARMAQDPARRERTFKAIRTLGDYARIARLIGAAHLEMLRPYRRFAATLDDAANVLRMLAGESIYEAGLDEGGLILNVPLTDLHQRGDTLLEALRQLLATDQKSSGDYGEGLADYRELLDEIDDLSEPELKTYLREETLSCAIDELIDNVSGAVTRQDPALLRELAATLPIEIDRLERLRAVAQRILDDHHNGNVTASSALSRFVQALALFTGVLAQPRSGARLVELAMPLAMAGARSGEADGDARRILRELLSCRIELAREADCFLVCCSGSPDDLGTQVKLDAALYHVDRAIDLYAQGSGHAGAWGEEEQRAAVIGVVLHNAIGELKDSHAAPKQWLSALKDALVTPLPNLTKLVDPDSKELLDKELLDLVQPTLQDMQAAERAWAALASSFAPRCGRIAHGTDPLFVVPGVEPPSSVGPEPSLQPLPKPPPPRWSRFGARLARTSIPVRNELKTGAPLGSTGPDVPPASDPDERANVIFLLHLTGMALAEVETITGSDARTSAWESWMRVIRDGQEMKGALRSRQAKVNVNVRGWTESGAERTLAQVVGSTQGQFAKDLDQLFRPLEDGALDHKKKLREECLVQALFHWTSK